MVGMAEPRRMGSGRGVVGVVACARRIGVASATPLEVKRERVSKRKRKKVEVEVEKKRRR